MSGELVSYEGSAGPVRRAEEASKTDWNMGKLQIVLVQKPQRQTVRCEDKNNPLPTVDWMCETCGEQALFAHPRGNR